MPPKISKAKAILSKFKGLAVNTLSPFQYRSPSPIPANQSTSEPVQAPIAIGERSVQSAPGATAGPTSTSPASGTFNDPGNTNTTMLQAFHPLSAMATGQSVLAPAAAQAPSQLASGVSPVPVIHSPAVNTARTTGNAVSLQAPAMHGNLSAVAPTVTSAVPHSRPALTTATVNAPGRSLPSSNVSSTPMPSSVSVSAANQVPVETNTVTSATPVPVTFVPAAATSKENDSWEMAKSALDTILNLLLQSSDAFPPLKSAIGGLVGVINLFKSAAANREDYSQLESELGNMVATLKHYGELNPKEPDGSVTHTLLHIQEEVTEIKKIQSHGRTRQFTEATRDKDDIIKRYRTIQSLVQQLQVSLPLFSANSSNIRMVDQHPVSKFGPHKGIETGIP
ncbi:hypothetical protein H0H87_005285 [Tephrocybe sp. NHM501043]|nr:hypothetical protein H0H87_005285 [Tephrocybe sp. NHM501043]